MLVMLGSRLGASRRLIVRWLNCVLVMLPVSLAQAQTLAAPVATSPEPAWVAVMPFANLSRHPADDWIGEGIAQTVSAELAKVGLTLVDCNIETASYSAYADACAAATTYSDSAALSATRWKPVYARGSCEPTTSGGLGSFSCWPMASPTRLYRRCCGATRPSWPGGRAGSSTIVWPGSSPVIRGGPSRNERRGSRPAFSTGRDVAHRMARPTGRRGSSRSTLGRIT